MKTRTLRFTSFLFLFSAMIFISSCNKDELYLVDFKYEYFPLQVGSWIEYEVDSITYDNNFDPPAVDTANFILKELIESAFIDAGGNTAYRIERYRKESDSADYVLMNVIYQSVNDKEADRVEGSLRYTKLVFPLLEGTTWNGNAKIDATGEQAYLAGWEYEVTSIDVPMTFGSQVFDSTVTVLQIEDENLIEKKYSEESYAKGVGLIFKETMHLEKQNVLNGWDKPEEGFILRMTIIAHG